MSTFSADLLQIDAAQVASEIQGKIREQVMGTLRRRGAVVGLSGGVDSSVVAALCVGALGKEKVRLVLGVDVGYPPAVPDDLHGLADPINEQAFRRR